MNSDNIDKNVNIETENNDYELKKTLNKSRKTLMLVITVAIVIVILALVYFSYVVNSIISDPIVRFVSATQKTVTAYSATINADIENTNTKGAAKIDGKYEINPVKRQFSAIFDITSKAFIDKAAPETKINIIVSCENDGGIINYTKDEKISKIQISESTAKRFFDTFSGAEEIDPKNLSQSLENFINDAGLEDYINSDEVEGSLYSIYNALNSDEGRTLALGITEKNVNDKNVISFEIDPYRTSNIILSNAKPMIKHEEDYEKYKNLIDKYKSFLNSILIKFDVSINEDGFIDEINADNLGIIANIKISDINKTKIR